MTYLWVLFNFLINTFAEIIEYKTYYEFQLQKSEFALSIFTSHARDILQNNLSYSYVKPPIYHHWLVFPKNINLDQKHSWNRH